MKTANFFAVGLAGLALVGVGCAGTSAKLDSEREYVHQLNAPTKPYHVTPLFYASGGEVGYS